MQFLKCKKIYLRKLHLSYFHFFCSLQNWGSKLPLAIYPYVLILKYESMILKSCYQTRNTWFKLFFKVLPEVFTYGMMFFAKNQITSVVFQDIVSKEWKKLMRNLPLSREALASDPFPSCNCLLSLPLVCSPSHLQPNMTIATKNSDQ